MSLVIGLHKSISTPVKLAAHLIDMLLFIKCDHIAVPLLLLVSSMQIAGLGTRGSGTCGTGTAVLGHAELGQRDWDRRYKDSGTGTCGTGTVFVIVCMERM